MDDLFVLLSFFVLAAAGLGFALGRWWIQRHFLENYESRQRHSEAANRAQLEYALAPIGARLDAMESKLTQGLGRALHGVVKSELGETARVLGNRVTDLDSRFNELVIRLVEVDVAVKGLSRTVTAELDRLAQSNGKMEAALAARETVRPATPDLGGRAVVVEKWKSSPPEPPPPETEQVPRLVETPAYGGRDDLKKIHGVGRALESLLNRLGIWYFWQIAEWSAEEVRYIDRHLAVRGRITRDEWVEQAQSLAKESERKPPHLGVAGLPEDVEDDVDESSSEDHIVLFPGGDAAPEAEGDETQLDGDEEDEEIELSLSDGREDSGEGVSEELSDLPEYGRIRSVGSYDDEEDDDDDELEVEDAGEEELHADRPAAAASGIEESPEKRDIEAMLELGAVGAKAAAAN